MNEELVDLPDVAQLSKHCVRILGQNPGPYTLQGTNTYLVSGRSSLLVDTGDGEKDYVPHLRSALVDRPPVSDIVLTHWHHDHVDGLPDVLDLLAESQKGELPRIWKKAAAGSDHDLPVEECLRDKAGRFEPAASSSSPSQVHALADGHTFDLGGPSLRVVETPGHTDDSISLILDSEGSTVILTADTVLGQGTAVFEDLATYLASLRKLVGLTSKTSKTALWPGHGPVIEDGRDRMEHYISHRMEREEQVVAALKSGNEPMTPEALVKVIYPPQLPDAVVPAAARGLVQHLQKLAKEGKVQPTGDAWRLVRAQL